MSAETKMQDHLARLAADHGMSVDELLEKIEKTRPPERPMPPFDPEAVSVTLAEQEDGTIRLVTDTIVERATAREVAVLLGTDAVRQKMIGELWQKRLSG